MKKHSKWEELCAPVDRSNFIHAEQAVVLRGVVAPLSAAVPLAQLLLAQKKQTLRNTNTKPTQEAGHGLNSFLSAGGLCRVSSFCGCGTINVCTNQKESKMRDELDKL